MLSPVEPTLMVSSEGFTFVAAACSPPFFRLSFVRDQGFGPHRICRRCQPLRVRPGPQRLACSRRHELYITKLAQASQSKSPATTAEPKALGCS